MNQIGLSHVQGWRWQGGRLLADIDYDKRSRLRAADRKFFSDDLRALGGPDLRVAYCAPGTITRGATTVPVPKGQDGAALSPSQLTPGGPNLCDSKEGSDILPEQERISAYISASEDLGARVRLFTEISGAQRWFDVRSPSIIGSPITVPITNAYYVNPFAGAPAPLSMTYSFLHDLGAPRTHGRSSLYAVTTGADFTLPADWNAEIYLSRSRSDGRSLAGDQVNTFYLNQALASANRATAFNPFGDGDDTPQAVINAIRGYSLFDYSNDFYDASAHIGGKLLALPGGDLKLSAGAEYRLEAFDDVQLSFLSSAAPSTSANLHEHRSISAGFAELQAPIVGPDNRLPGVEALKLSLAARTEHYSDFGDTTNPKVGADWTLVDGLMIKGVYGAAFRAPGFDDLRADLQAAQVLTIADPASPTGTTRVLARLLNRPDLGPEKAHLGAPGLCLIRRR